MAKFITVKMAKPDANGRPVYVYNFVDELFDGEQKDLNAEFNIFGRLSKYGIRSNYTPQEVASILRQPLLSLPVSRELQVAQNRIDSCNNRRGCSSCCGQLRIQQCTKVRVHAAILDKKSYLREFLNAPMKMIE